MSRFDEKKALAAILYLARKRGAINLYALLKTLYYADKNHFQEWGRSITRDAYYRLPYGPVPSSVYDMLKSVRGDGHWYRDLSAILRFKDDRTIVPLEEPDFDELSESDIEALDASYAERGEKAFEELCDEAYRDPAVKRSSVRKMTQEDLAEDDPVLLEHLKEIRENEQFLKDWRSLAPWDEEEICEQRA